MTIKVGINGLGRIGRLALKVAWEWPEFEFVQFNDPAGNAETFAHLLNFDSIHVKWCYDATHSDTSPLIECKKSARRHNLSRIHN